jgi:hypothetical protein
LIRNFRKRGMKMTAEKDADLADLIKSQIGMDWDSMLTDMHEISTEELIMELTSLELYVNKKFAQEVARRNDAVFHLRKLIQDGRYWNQTGSGKGWSPIHAIHILALIKNREALQLLLDTVRYRGDDLDLDNVASLLIAFGEDAIEPLKDFTKDETLEAFARSTATTTLVMLTRNNPSYKNTVMRYLIDLLNSTGEDTFASLLVQDIALFHDTSIIPEIHKVFEEEKILEFFMREENFISKIKGKDDEKEIEMNTKDPLSHFSRDNIERLHKIQCKEEDFSGLKEDDFEPEIDDDNFESEEKENKPKKEKIGRNDPCPCGSGKKYKKCCMSKEK